MSKRVSNKKGEQRVTPARARRLKQSVIGVKYALRQMQAEARKQQAEARPLPQRTTPSLWQRAKAGVSALFAPRMRRMGVR